MKSTYSKFIFGACILTGCVLIVRLSGINEFFSVEAMRSTVLGYGVYAPLVYIFLYALAAVLFVPGTPLTLAGGAIFGSLGGTVYTIIGATIGAILSFLLTRSFGGGIMRTGASGIRAKLAHYDTRLSTHGFVTVLFLRLVPLFPFNGLNFALGLTSVRFRDFVLGTFLGIIPGTFVFVYFGDSLASLNTFKILIAISAVIGLAIGGRFVLKRFGTQ